MPVNAMNPCRFFWYARRVCEFFEIRKPLNFRRDLGQAAEILVGGQTNHRGCPSARLMVRRLPRCGKLWSSSWASCLRSWGMTKGLSYLGRKRMGGRSMSRSSLCRAALKWST